MIDWQLIKYLTRNIIFRQKGWSYVEFVILSPCEQLSKNCIFVRGIPIGIFVFLATINLRFKSQISSRNSCKTTIFFLNYLNWIKKEANCVEFMFAIFL